MRKEHTVQRDRQTLRNALPFRDTEIFTDDMIGCLGFASNGTKREGSSWTCVRSRTGMGGGFLGLVGGCDKHIYYPVLSAFERRFIRNHDTKC